MKELEVKNDTLFIMIPIMYGLNWKYGNRNSIDDEYSFEEDEMSPDDLIEEFNYSMLRVLSHNYIWDEFINDATINIVENVNIPFDRLARTETYKWKANKDGSLRTLCAFTLSGIKKAEQEGKELPIDIMEFKHNMEHSNNFMTVHSLNNNMICEIIIIRNFSGTVVLDKNDDCNEAEEIVTIQASNNNDVVIR